MTNEELQNKVIELHNQIAELQRSQNELRDVYYRTHYIDRDVFSNPVYLSKVFIPKIAGTPTNTPGGLEMVYDTTNNKLYVYNGAWKSVTLT